MRKNIAKMLMGDRNTDDVERLERQLAASRSTAAAAASRITHLGGQRLAGDTFEAVRAIEEQLAEARWSLDRVEPEVPRLEAELAAAKLARRHRRVAHHQAVMLGLYPKFRAALATAVAAQEEAIAAHEAAAADIGGGLAQSFVPVPAFAGFLRREHLNEWVMRNDRVFTLDAMPQPGTARRAPLPPQVPALAILDAPRRAAPVPKPEPLPQTPTKPRMPRLDPLPTDDTHRAVTINHLGAGVDFGDGFGSVAAGDIVSLRTELAEKLVDKGKAQFYVEPEGP